MKLQKNLCRVIAAGAASLGLTACGGGSSDDPASSPPTAAPHAAATVRLDAGNTRYVMVHAQAVQHVLRSWAQEAVDTVLSSSPQGVGAPKGCAQGQSLETRYVDTDRDGKVSAGDQVLTSANGCIGWNFGSGRGEFSLSRVDAGTAKDVRLTVAGTTQHRPLYIYGWQQTMNGAWRLFFVDSKTVRIVNDGDVTLALPSGQTLTLRNVEIDFSNEDLSIGGRFDLGFAAGAEAGRTLQVDLLGRLNAPGANQGPMPGALQIVGANGTRARLVGHETAESFSNFLTTADFAGSGTLTPFEDILDTAFYAAFKVPVSP